MTFIFMIFTAYTPLLGSHWTVRKAHCPVKAYIKLLNKHIKQNIWTVATCWEETHWVICITKILFLGSQAFPGQSTAQEANTPRAPQELTISLYLKVATQYKLTYYAIKNTGKFVLLCPAFPGQWLLNSLPRKGLLLHNSLHIKLTIWTIYISKKANFMLKNI